MSFEDQLKRKIVLSSAPQRIVSLVPSQSELLCFLGLEEQIVGVTAYCVEPPGLLENKTVVGGTKNFDIQKILALDPDLVIANKEENPPGLVEALAAEVPVWVSDVNSLHTAREMILGIGALCRRSEAALQLVQQIDHDWAQLPRLARPLRFLFVIWKDPYMVASRDTYISQLLKSAGFENACQDTNGRYPTMDETAIAKSDAEVVFLTSEPYCFSTAELFYLSDKYDKKEYRIVNGQNFSWYGSRIIQSINTIDRIIRQLNLKFS